MQLARLSLFLTPAQVLPLLQAISGRLDGGFTAAEAIRFSEDLAAVGAGEDGLVEPKVQFKGDEHPFVISIFKETTTSLSAVFIGPPQLIEMVREGVQGALGEMNVHLIPASAIGEAQ